MGKKEDQLLRAAEQGDVEKVRGLLKTGILRKRTDVNAMNAKGWTPLMLAAYQKHLRILQLLLAQGAEVDGKDRNSETALILATRQGDNTIVQALLTSGANVDAKDKYGETPLIIAARKGDVTTAQLLLTSGADVNAKNLMDQTALHYAALGGHADTVQALLAKSADVNAKDFMGRTALMAAAGNGHSTTVDVLLASGADVNAIGSDGATALMLAADQSHMEIVNALLAQGANVNTKSSKGETALMHAVNKGDTSIVQALLAQGADVNCKDNRGLNSLMIAASQGYTELAKILVAERADLDARDNEGWTPIIYATYNGHIEVVQSLKKAGANTSVAIAMEKAGHRQAHQMVEAKRRETATQPASSLSLGVTTRALCDLQDLPGIGEVIKCSGECLHWGVVRSLGDPKAGFTEEYAMVDTTRYLACRRITPAAELPVVQFSSDGMVWGYSAARGHREFVVINGSESNYYPELIHPSFGFDLSLSEQGGHYAFGARKAEKSFAVIDGVEAESFDDVGSFEWNHDGSRYACSVKFEGHESVVIDGERGKSYDSVSWPQFSSNGRRVAYKAESGERALVLLDHDRVAESYDQIEALTFGSAGQGVSFWAITEGVGHLMVEGRPVGISIPAKSYSQYWQIIFKPDGSEFAALGTSKDGKHTVFQNTRKVGAYEQVDQLIYDGLGRLLFLAEDDDRHWFLVIDGERQSQNYQFSHYLTVAPESGRYFFVHYGKDSISVVLDGSLSNLKFDRYDPEFLKFSPDGSHISYVGSRPGNSRARSRQKYVVVDEQELGPYDEIAGTHFAANGLLRFIALRAGVVELVEWIVE